MKRKMKILYGSLHDRKWQVVLTALLIGLVTTCVILTLPSILRGEEKPIDIFVLSLNGLTVILVCIGLRRQLSLLEKGIVIPRAFWRKFIRFSDISYISLNVRPRDYGAKVREVEVHTNDFQVYFISGMEIANWERFERVLTEDLRDQVEVRK